MGVPTIKINMDGKCLECGKSGGTTDSGICLNCATRALKGGLMKSKAGLIVQKRFQERGKSE